MRRIALLFALFLRWTLALSQDVSFEARVDRNQVSLGEQFTLSLELKNARMWGGKNLQLPDLSKLHIMAGPSQSTNMQFSNGVVYSSVTYSYILQPREVGKLTIGSATIEAEGKQYRSTPVTIEVVKGSPRPQRQQASTPEDLGSQIGDNLFLRATVDRSRVMQGEQVNLTFKLYTRVSVSNYAVEKTPTTTGFWSEEIENPKNIELGSEVINGKQYKVGVIRRVALFPTQSGTLEVSPMEVQTTVQIQSRSVDPFDAFFRDPFGRPVNYSVKSEPLKIKVDPLPPGAPTGFKGAIGSFKMNTSLDKRTTKTNEPISLKVTIAGTGNIKLLESPEVSLPTDFEQYTPKVTDNINRQPDRISGSKTFEYLLIPRYPGEKSIKPITFVYYDLGKHDYVTLRTPSMDLTVEQGPASAMPLVTGSPREDVQLLSQDIRFIKVTGADFSRRGEYVHTRGLFVALVLLPLAGLMGALVYTRNREAVMRDEAGFRNKRAIKIAHKGLKRAEVFLKEKTAASPDKKLKFYSEIAKALWSYLGDKLAIPPAEYSIDGILATLNRRSVDSGTAAALKSLLEYCEMARFAPTSTEKTAMQKTYEEAKTLIVELERTLRGR